VLSTHGLDVNGMLHFYQIQGIGNPAMEEHFIEHTKWDANKAKPLIISNSEFLSNYFDSSKFFKGSREQQVGSTARRDVC
jgi:uridine phosphorylase